MSKRERIPEYFSKKIMFGNLPRKLKKRIWGTRDRPTNKRIILVTLLYNQSMYMKKIGMPAVFTPEDVIAGIARSFPAFTEWTRGQGIPAGRIISLTGESK